MSLVKRMGWTAKKTKTISSIPPETLSAIEEARSGKDAGIVNMESLDSFIRSKE
jgi:predicted  nucleic acid-binding Zn-ribbon protein